MCGIFAVANRPDAAELTQLGLFDLQHRGQESAGIVTVKGGELQVKVGMGLVSEVFADGVAGLPGKTAIGHVRYATTGASSLKNAQPLVFKTGHGPMAVAHNGNLTNANLLRDELEAYGSIFQSTVDSEIIVHLLAQPLRENREASLISVLRRIQGAFSLIIMSEGELIGVRDPLGFRPLCIGKLGDAWILASETCALDQVHAKFVRDVAPGELVIINQNGLRAVQYAEEPGHALCIFEYVYFARPDSTIHGQNVYRVRVNLGRQLAREHPVAADIVIPVPDSGNAAALGFSQESGIPFEMAFVRNHYTGRTFLQPSQLIRDFGVRIKLNLIKELVRGKRVVVVDDSIVRGTTARARVSTLREAGAKEVHMRISCPPHKWPCHYGIDFPTRDELIAVKNSPEKIREYLCADSIGYLSLDGMIRATGLPATEFCHACYSGDYPVSFDENLDKYIIERRRGARQPLSELVEEETQQGTLL